MENERRACIACPEVYVGELNCPNCGAPGEPLEPVDRVGHTHGTGQRPCVDWQQASRARANRILDYLEEASPEAIRYDGCDDAIIGVAERGGQPPLLVYDRIKLVRCIEAQGASMGEAEEWVSYNIEGAWMGRHTPLILYRFDH